MPRISDGSFSDTSACCFCIELLSIFMAFRFAIRSIRAELALWSCLISILLTLVLVYSLGIFATSNVREQIGLKLSGLAHHASDKLDQAMFERYREFQLMAMRPTLGDPDVSVAEKQHWLEQIQRTYGSYSWIGVTDLQGKVLASTGGLLVGADVSQRPWFGNALNGIHVGDVHDAKLLASKLPNPSGEPIRFVDVAFPYFDLDGRMAGVLGAHMSWKWADHVRDSVMTAAVVQKGMEAFILAQDGTVLLGPRDMVGAKLDLNSLKRAQQEQNDYLIESWPDGKDYLVGFSPTLGYQTYPGLGWTVLVRQPVGDAFAPVGHMQRNVLMTGLAIAFLFSLFGLFNARRIARPLISLADKARQLRLGETKSMGEVPPSYSEINELTAAIGSLVGQLQKESGALQELNASLEQRVEMRTAQLAQSEERLRTVTDSIPALIAYVDTEQVYRFCNKTYQAWFNRSEEQIIGSKVEEVLGEGVYRQVAPHLAAALRGEPHSFELVRDNGKDLQYLKVTYRPHRTEEGKVLGVYVLKQDITDSKKYQMALQHDLLTDGLTGLRNRAAYLEALYGGIARARRVGKPIAVMFLDVDKFKRINDTYGHEAGDKVLIEFGVRLGSCLRETDTVARLGGDEFTILLEKLSEEADARKVAEKILQAMQAPFEIGSGVVPVSTSIGIVVSEGHDATAEDLMQRADAAMYQSKRAGRNRITIHGTQAAVVSSSDEDATAFYSQV
jgi:diguanylate cyclase (GGDEF)-like protein/PAS domain S-box-containing protein